MITLWEGKGGEGGGSRKDLWKISCCLAYSPWLHTLNLTFRCSDDCQEKSCESAIHENIAEMKSGWKHAVSFSKGLGSSMPLSKLRTGHVWKQQLIGCSQSFCQSEQSLTLFPSLTGVVPTVPTISVRDDLAELAAADRNTLPLNQQFPAGVLYLSSLSSTSLTHWLLAVPSK